jgi:hypothetical protein
MVGALADWFASPPSFAIPLGIPIPHTAIIPRNKESDRRKPWAASSSRTSSRRRSSRNASPRRLSQGRTQVAGGACAGRVARRPASPRSCRGSCTRSTTTTLRRFRGEHLVAGVRKIDFATIAAEVLELLTGTTAITCSCTQLIDQAKDLLESSSRRSASAVRKEVWWGLRTVAVDEVLYYADHRRARAVSRGDARHADARDARAHRRRGCSG